MKNRHLVGLAVVGLTTFGTFARGEVIHVQVDDLLTDAVHMVYPAWGPEQGIVLTHHRDFRIDGDRLGHAFLGGWSFADPGQPTNTAYALIGYNGIDGSAIPLSANTLIGPDCGLNFFGLKWLQGADVDGFSGDYLAFTDGYGRYGWMRLTFQGPVGLYVHDYAYETTPNVPILAGGPAAPEPASLTLLGLGTMALLRRRPR